MSNVESLTQWTTVKPYVTDPPTWVPPEELERISSYAAYEGMYWNVEDTFELIRRSDDGASILVPKPMVVVNTTAYYLLKGLRIKVDTPETNSEFVEFLDNFLKREAFFSRWNTAKHSGVMRGDWLFHITANEEKAENTRISLTSIDPAVYFPEYDPDDMTQVISVRLVEQWEHPDDPEKFVIKELKYWYGEPASDGRKTVWREENLWEVDEWDSPENQVRVKSTLPAAQLPEDISVIPVYHFRNQPADGYPFGNSELRGFERIFQAINQAISDEEIALALSGLGVYVTDAGRPINARGEETDWVAAPGAVWEMPGATLAKRLDGVSTVTPVQDHLTYLGKMLNEGSGTSDVALGDVDSQTAESGVALALKFIPTLAKIESRDEDGLALLNQMWYDWKFWVKAFEGKDWTEVELVISLGEKLPLNRTRFMDELNNMFDRKIISGAYYREQMTEQLGYTFPEDIFTNLLEEHRQLAEIQMIAQLPVGSENPNSSEDDTLEDQNNSNNRNRVNESNGTEINTDV